VTSPFIFVTMTWRLYSNNIYNRYQKEKKDNNSYLPPASPLLHFNMSSNLKAAWKKITAY